MAVDRKTGKPVADAVAVARAFAEDLARAGVIAAAQVGAVADEFARAAQDDLAHTEPPDLAPRGVSLLRGAYGPWLAAREMREAREGTP
jgi:hypothetical protein